MLNLRPIVILLIILALLIVLTVAAFLFTPLRAYVVKRYQHIFLIIIASLGVEIIVSPFRGYTGMEVSSVVGFTAYLVTTQFFLKRYSSSLKTYQIGGLVLAGLMILQLPVRLIDFKGSLISFPDMLLAALGIFAGVCFYHRQQLLYKVNLSLSVVIVAFTFFYGYNLWAHNLDFGNLTGNVYAKGPQSITLVSKTASPITVAKGKITVMDFWFVGCGQCLREFPNFQKTYNKYKTNSKIQFYSVNKPTAYDNGVDRFKMLTDMGYNFPMTVCEDASLVKKMDIVAYPTLVILNENGDVIYKGDVTGAEEKLQTLL